MVYKIFPGRFPEDDEAEDLIIGSKSGYKIRDLYVNVDSIEGFSPISDDIVWVSTKGGNNLILDITIEDFIKEMGEYIRVEPLVHTKKKESPGDDILGDIDFSSFEDD